MAGVIDQSRLERAVVSSESDEPPHDGHTRRFVLRLLETLLRRPILSLLPLLLFVGLGVASVMSSERTFVSTGVLSVPDQTMLATLSDLPGSDGFGWETPATVTSQRINEMLGTDEFSRRLATDAGLDDEIEAGVIELDDIREWVSASPSGANFVRIRASSFDPDISFRLATATPGAFVEWIIEGDVSQSVAAERFFESVLEGYEAELEEAQAALASYVEQNPAPDGGVRPPEQEAEIARLNSHIEQALARTSRTTQNIEGARLSIEQTRSDISQRLRVVDEPQLATRPESSRRQVALLMGLYVMAGLFFSGAIVAVGAVLDRGLRNAHDVADRLDARVLATIPEASR